MLRSFLVCIVACIVCLAVSCKKSESGENKTRREMLLGTWRWVEYGPDSINLNQLDTIEVSPFSINFYVYMDNGEGFNIQKYTSGSSTVIDTLDFTWILSQDQSRIISTYQNPLLAHIDSIHTLNNTQLITLDNGKSKGGLYNYWKVMVKQ